MRRESNEQLWAARVQEQAASDLGTKEALDMIGKLYRIEAMARKKMLPGGLTETERTYQWRHEKSWPILDAFHAWLVSNQKEVMPQPLIGKAINYALGQWIYIYRYIDNGGYAIDDNIIGRDIRPFATARKAWLFASSAPGADASAVIYSLTLTCRACSIKPYAWLRHVLTEFPKRQPGDDVTDLLPFDCAGG